MPYMPRSDHNAKKIAWKVLGKPDNLATKETPEQRAIKAKLDYQVIVDGR